MHVALSWLHSQCLYQVVKAYYLRPHGTRCPPVAHDSSLSSRHVPSKTSLCVSAGEKNTRSPPLGQLTPAPSAPAPSAYDFFTDVAKKMFHRATSELFLGLANRELGGTEEVSNSHQSWFSPEKTNFDAGKVQICPLAFAWKTSSARLRAGDERWARRHAEGSCNR